MKTENESKGATERPWTYGTGGTYSNTLHGANGRSIGSVNTDEDGALIVSAVNERAGLLAERDALAARVAELEGALRECVEVLRDSWGSLNRETEDRAIRAQTAARAALSGGKGGAA